MVTRFLAKKRLFLDIFFYYKNVILYVNIWNNDVFYLNIWNILYVWMTYYILKDGIFYIFIWNILYKYME